MIDCFDRDLAELKERLLTMASHAEWAVARSVQAFVERDDEVVHLCEGRKGKHRDVGSAAA